MQNQWYSIILAIASKKIKWIVIKKKAIHDSKQKDNVPGKILAVDQKL